MERGAPRWTCAYHDSWVSMFSRSDMSGECDGQSSKRKPPIAVPLTLIALGAAAVAVPIILLRGLRRTSTTVRDLQNAPPRPTRRVPGISSHTSPVIGAESSPLSHRHVKSPFEAVRAGDLPLGRDASEHTMQSRFNGGIYALQALGIATCIVGASAVTGVLAIRWAMGVQSAEELAARLRTKIQSLTPTLSSRIHRRHSGSSEEVEAAERLSRAYEEGGLAEWMTVVEKELEREVEEDRRRQTPRGGESVGT